MGQNYTLTLNLQGADYTDASLKKIGADLDAISGKGKAVKMDLSGVGDAVKKLNPHLAAYFGQVGTITGLKDQPYGKMLGKIAAMGDVTDDAMKWFESGIKNHIKNGWKVTPTTQGLRDVAGSDLAKVFAMGQFGVGTIKGLRDVGGSDLAKVHAMGSFEENTKAPSFFEKLGQFGPLAKFGTIIGTVTVALDLFKKSITVITENLREAIARGHQLYTQSAQQGLSAQFYQQRQSVADLLGVSNPTDIYRFGNAIQELMQRTKMASNILAETAKPLAAVEINFRILRLDMQALWAIMATKLAPVINLVVKGLDFYVRKMIEFGHILGKLAGLGIFGNLGKILKGALDLIGKIEGSSAGLPNLNTTMNQLPASAWEKMGLVIGGSGPSTNDLIRKSNQYLSVIASAVTGKGNGNAGGYHGGVNPFSLGINPLVAAP